MAALSGGLPWGDPLVGADAVRDRLDHTFACPSCGSQEPARVEGGACSDCAVFPRCAACRRWLLGEDMGEAIGVLDEHGDPALVCAGCWERAY